MRIRHCAFVALLAMALSMASFAVAASAAAAPAAKARTTPAAALPMVDINSASKDELAKLPGIGAAYAAKIIGGRPYANKTQLLSHKVLPPAVYDKAAPRLIAKQVVAKTKGTAPAKKK